MGVRRNINIYALFISFLLTNSSKLSPLSILQYTAIKKHIIGIIQDKNNNIPMFIISHPIRYLLDNSIYFVVREGI